MIKNNKGEDKLPAVHFRAEDLGQDSLMPKKKPEDDEADKDEESEGQGGDMDEMKIEGKLTKTGKLNRAKEMRGGPGEGGVESYSGTGREQPARKDGESKFVRWSTSTEIGDFIRDAARGKEFEVEIQGAPDHIRVGVPSFKDRTHFLRMRLRKTSRKLADLASVKQECDVAAHKGAQTVALGGFGVLVAYWYIVYRLTFETDLG
jgi:hypothetical protein